MRSARFVKNILALILIRVRLLLRQKLGWISVIVGCGLVLLSLLISEVSFINPQKIFWDFSLGVIFILQLALAIFLGSQLYHEERGRRTLHLILSAGVSRFEWLLGNGLGIWISLTLMNVLWFGLTLLSSKLMFVEGGLATLAAQAMVLLGVEVLIVVFMSMLFSLFVRQMLALSLSAILVLLLHSMSSVQRIFSDPQVGRFVDDNGVSLVLWLARLLPPLEWLDLKSLVGYENSVSTALVAQMICVGALWSLLLLCLSWLRFEKLDL